MVRLRRVAPALLAMSGAAQWGCENLESARGAEGLLQVVLLQSQTTPEQAVEWANDPYDPDNRARGTSFLASATYASQGIYLSLFERNIADSEPAVRAVSARALGRHGRPEHVALIIPLLSDEDDLVRREAARALQRLHHPDALAPLLERLKPDVESSDDVRAEVALALGQYREPRVVDELISSMFLDRSLAVNHGARRSLRILTGQDLGYDAGAWQGWIAGHRGVALAAGRVYTYPVFSRAKRLIEYIPFVPPPPNETARPPIGLAPPGG